ncbi:TPA: ArgE/DapE family deacylase [Staphylococcus pseudintermedius]
MSVFTAEDKIKILEDLVGIKTVNDNEIEVCHYLQNLFKQHGIESQIDPINDSRANLIATIGEGKPVLGISGHMDVVSEGDKDDWTYDPFILTEDDGYLYGRGSGDMKSGLAALAIALIEIKQSGQLKQGTIRFMATSGEEMEQKGSEQLYKKGYMDEVDALVIAEPSETAIVYAQKGSMDLCITSKGVSSHSSMPIFGRNSITPLVQFIQNIDQEYSEIIKKATYEKLDFSSFCAVLAEKYPDILNFEQAKKVLSGLVINNTLISGGEQVNSVPAKARADFNIRTVSEYNNDDVKKLFQKHLDKINDQGYDLSLDIYLDLEPVLTTGDNSLIKMAHELAKEKLENSIIISPTTGVTDAANLLRDKGEDFPLMIFGPGERPHQVDERVKKDSYFTFIDLYQTLFINYLNET